MSAHEHIVIHLHPRFKKKLERIMRREHYSSIEELILNAVAEYYLRNK